MDYNGKRYIRWIRLRHQRRYRKPSFRFPHIVNEETKEVFVYVVSGYPTVLAIPNLVSRNYPNYSHHLCSKGYFDKLVAEQKEKQLDTISLPCLVNEWCILIP